MDNSGISTSGYRHQEEQADEISSIKSILQNLKSEREMWKEKITSLLSNSGLSPNSFAKLCGVSRPALLKWCNGSLPSSREEYIRIGFAAQLNLDELNAFLVRYGKYPGLYPKSLEDSVYIFILHSDKYPHTYDFCLETISKFREKIGADAGQNDFVIDTAGMKKVLLSMESLQELETFIGNNAASYSTSYAKFYSYVKAFIIMNSKDPVYDTELSLNSLANMQQWTSSMKQCVYAINRNEWFPVRRKVIALGIHLNMTVEQIDALLGLAQMEPLCAKNPVEGAVIYAVKDAELNNMIFCDGRNDLCAYVHKVILQIGIPEASALINDL